MTNSVNYDVNAYNALMKDERNLLFMCVFSVDDSGAETLVHRIASVDNRPMHRVFQVCENMYNKDNVRTATSYKNSRERHFKEVKFNLKYTHARTYTNKSKLKAYLEKENSVTMLYSDFLAKYDVAQVEAKEIVPHVIVDKHIVQTQFGELPPEKSTENDKILPKITEEER